jgi:DNA-binding response OmpR family regulator
MKPVGRVVVAEDERDVAELIRHTLTRERYEVVVAGTGTEALRQARELTGSSWAPMTT